MVWYSVLTVMEEIELERVQKVALRIILQENYENYENALFLTRLPTLKERRYQLCKPFATKCTKNEKTRDIFPLNPSTVQTRHLEKYQQPD